MLRTGMIVLSIWSGLNLLMGVTCNAVMVLNQNSPGFRLLFGDSTIQEYDPSIVAAINSMAMLCNALVAACCLLALVVIWTGLAKRATSAFWGLLIALGWFQLFGFVSVAYYGGGWMVLSYYIVSSAVLVVGLGFSACALYRQDRVRSRVASPAA